MELHITCSLWGSRPICRRAQSKLDNINIKLAMNVISFTTVLRTMLRRSVSSRQIIILMGCAPPEKRHKSVPAVNAVPSKTPHLSPRHSEQSKNSTQGNENNLLQLPLPKLPSNETLKSQRKQSKPEKANFPSRQSLQSPQRFSYEHRDSPEKPMEKEIIRIVSPRDKLKSPKKEEE